MTAYVEMAVPSSNEDIEHEEDVDVKGMLKSVLKEFESVKKEVKAVANKNDKAINEFRA